MPFPSTFKFCPHCATALEPYEHEGIDRRRCLKCQWIQYRNPTVGVAVIVIEGDQLLVGLRRNGGWCIPCGHVEFNETIETAARREMKEETGLDISLSEVFAVKSNFHDRERQTVGVWFRGVRDSGCLTAGGDLIDVDFVSLSQLPALIFPTDRAVVDELQRMAK